MTNPSLKVRKKPYLFGGTRIEVGGEDYHIKYSGCSEIDALERARQMVEGESYLLLKKGGSLEIKIQDSK